MNTSTTPYDTVVPTRPRSTTPPCRRCRCRGRGFTYAEAGPDQWPYEIPCVACAPQGDDDPDGGGGGQWNHDIGESCPDDSSRFAAVAARYHTGRVA